MTDKPNHVSRAKGAKKTAAKRVARTPAASGTTREAVSKYEDAMNARADMSAEQKRDAIAKYKDRMKEMWG